MTDENVKKPGFHPHVTIAMEQARKSQAQKFIKKLENNKEAMQIFIDKLKQEDSLEFNTTRQQQIAK
jgi:2'-5' RNA ligase